MTLSPRNLALLGVAAVYLMLFAILGAAAVDEHHGTAVAHVRHAAR